MRIGQIFAKNINLDTFLTKIVKKLKILMNFCQKKGLLGERLLKIGCELFKMGVIG